MQETLNLALICAAATKVAQVVPRSVAWAVLRTTEPVIQLIQVHEKDCLQALILVEKAQQGTEILGVTGSLFIILLC